MKRAPEPRAPRSAHSRWFVWVAAALAPLLGLVTGLHTPWGVRALAQLALALANPWPGTEITVGGARGGFLTGIELHDLQLRARSGPLAARMDTLRLRYRPAELIGRPRRCREILVAGLGLVATRRPDGTLDVSEPFTGPPRTQGAPVHFALDRLEVRRGSLELRTPPLGRDSVLRAEAITLRIRNLNVHQTVTLTLEAFTTTLRAPGPPAALLRVSAAGTLESDRLVVSELAIAGARTRIAGGGSLPLPAADGIRLENARFRLSARPLAGEDITRFIPVVGDPGDVTLDLDAHGEGSSLRTSLDLRVARGGHATLEARLPAPGGPVEIRTRGRIHGLNVSAIYGLREALVADADWDVNLEGRDAAHLSGPFALRLDGTRVGAIRLDRAGISGHFQDGSASFDIRTVAAGLRLSAAGTSRPLDTIPTYEVNAKLSVPAIPAGERTVASAARSSDRGNPSAGRPPPTLFSGEVRVAARGQGISPRTATADVRVDLRADTPSLLSSGSLVVAWSRGMAQWRSEAAIAGGALRAEGDLALGPRLSYRVRSGEVAGVRPAAFGNDTIASRLDARFRIEGRGVDPDSASVTAEVTSLELTYGAHRVADVTLRLKLHDGRAALEAGGLLDGSTIDASAWLAPIRAPGEARLEARFRDLDLARVTGDTLLASDFAGRLVARIAARDLMALSAGAAGRIGMRDRGAMETARGSIHLDLEPGRFRDQHVSELVVEGMLDRRRLSMRGRLESSFGSGRFEGVALPFDETPSLHIGPAAFEGLDLRALSGPGAPRTDLRGSVAADLSGRDARSVEGDVRLVLDGSKVNRVTFDPFSAHAAVAGGRLDARVSARAGEDSADVTVSGEPLADPIRLEAHGAARFTDLAALLGLDSLRAETGLAFHLRAALPGSGDLRGLELSGRVDGHARADEARLDTLEAELHLADGLARIPRFALRGNVATLEGSGRIALLPGGRDSTSFRLEGTLGDLTPIASMAGLRDIAATGGRLSLSAAGPPGAARFKGVLAIRRPHLNEIWADTTTVAFAGRVRGNALAELDARIDARSLVLWPLRSRDLDATLRWDGRLLFVDTRSVVEGGRHQVIAGRIEPLPHGVRGRIERLELRHPGRLITLQEPAEFEAGNRIFLDHFVLLADGVPRLWAHGGIERDETVDVSFRVDSLDIADFTELAGLPALKGTLTAAGALTGTRSRPALACSVKAHLSAGRRPTARVTARLLWADAFDLKAAFEQTPQHGLSLTAGIPLALALPGGRGADGVRSGDAQRSGGVPVGSAPMSANLEARRFDLSWFEPLLSPRQARRPRGWLDGSLRAEGDSRQPSFTGSLALTGGRLELPGLGVEYRDGEAAIALSGRTITLERAHLESGGGRFDATGTVKFLGPTHRPVDLRTTLRRFVGMNTSQAKATVSGELSVSGEVHAPIVKGSLRVLESSLYAESGAQQAEAVPLTRRDYLDLQERFGIGVGASPAGKRTSLDSADVDVTLTIGDNVWIRRRSDPIVSLELKGDVRVRKPPGSAVDARGDLGVRTGRSYLSFVGRRFDITRAQTELPGPLEEAKVRLDAQYIPPSSGGARVMASVTADAKGVTTVLRSEPHMDQATLFKYLATGQVQGEIETEAAYGLAVGSALGAVGGAAGRSLGLDVVQVTMDAYGGQILSAGSYVDPRLYLGFRQPVVEGQSSGTGFSTGSNPTEFEVEYELRKSLLFNLQGNSSQYRFLLRPRLGR